MRVLLSDCGEPVSLCCRGGLGLCDLSHPRQGQHLVSVWGNLSRRLKSSSGISPLPRVLDYFRTQTLEVLKNALAQ